MRYISMNNTIHVEIFFIINAIYFTCTLNSKYTQWLGYFIARNSVWDGFAQDCTLNVPLQLVSLEIDLPPSLDDNPFLQSHLSWTCKREFFFWIFLRKKSYNSPLHAYTAAIKDKWNEIHERGFILLMLINKCHG